MSKLNTNNLLNQIVNQGESIEGIIIIDLVTSCVMNCDSQLQDKDQELYRKLIGDFGISEAFARFKTLNQLPIVLDEFGDITQFGKLEYTIFKLKKKYLVIYFTQVEDLPIIICYIFMSSTSIDSLIAVCENSIKTIIKQINEFFI